MEIKDSRRVPGPNLFGPRPCAALDVALEPGEADRFLVVYPRQLARLLGALGDPWRTARSACRPFRGGASFAIEAPLDALYSATEINEWAFAAAKAVLTGEGEPDPKPEAARLSDKLCVEREGRARLAELQVACAARGVALVYDDRQTSIGMGARSRVWRTRDLPRPEEVPWGELGDVPLALVTGTNGKSTTVRLLASMARAAGLVPGLSSTDWVRVGDETLEEGDFSGPVGLRRVLRDPRVQIAICETARGGMLRRGLGLARADAAAITNVAEDHLGEWGVWDLETLVETKFVIGRAVEGSGVLVLNADDPHVLARGSLHPGRVAWFSLSADHPRLAAHVAGGGEALWLAGATGTRLVRHWDGRTEECVRVADVPIFFGGAARHNLANALAALGLGSALGLPLEAMARGLCEFKSDPRDNPGRLNVFELGGARAIVDFAHNPHGFEALFDMVARLPAQRRCVLLGQAGDRDDASIRELVRIAWRVAPERVFIKEMPAYLRGREPGEVPKMIEDELRALGCPPERFEHHPTELDATKAALAWAREGDVLLLLAHSERADMLALLEGLRDRGWKPGQVL